MVQLTHGGDIYSARERNGNLPVLDFSANINPLGLPPSVKQAVIDGISDCIHYPDPLCRELIRELAAYEKVEENQLVCGNGAADLIFRLVVAKMPYRAMVLAPTFAEYEKSLESVGCLIEYLELSADKGFRLDEEILFRLNSSLDMLFLCNPNNPTGQVLNPTLLRQILCKCKEEGILLVLDECFIDFMEEPQVHTMKDFISDFDNLFILRAFTKNFAMPGFRLGYGICGNETLIKILAETGQPWSVSLPAQLAGRQALKETAYLEEARKLVAEERIYLQEELSQLGMLVYPPAANYIFFRLQDNGFSSETFQEKLSQRSILVRSCSNYIGLDSSYFRIAVKTRPENERLVTALQQIREV